MLWSHPLGRVLRTAYHSLKGFFYIMKFCGRDWSTKVHILQCQSKDSCLDHSKYLYRCIWHGRNFLKSSSSGKQRSYGEQQSLVFFLSSSLCFSFSSKGMLHLQTGKCFSLQAIAAPSSKDMPPVSLGMIIFCILPISVYVGEGWM